MSSELCLETGLTGRTQKVYSMSMPKFTDTISEKSRRKWIEEGHIVKAAPGGPDVEYDPFVDLEDEDEIAFLLQQSPGSDKRDYD